MQRVRAFQAAAACLCALTAAVRADVPAGQMTTYFLTGHQGGYGGEFTVTPLDAGLLPNSAYIQGLTAGEDGNPESFQSFCMEFDEDLNVNNTTVYDVTINTSGPTGSQAMLGGSGGPSDPLDARTAFLYRSFVQGTLAGQSGVPYAYVPGGDRVADAEALQDAIWFIEDEPGIVLSARAQDFVDAANAWLAGNPGAGIGSVRVINHIQTENGEIAQDLLYIIGEIDEPACGDGTVDAGEQCDDGNLEDGDGCSASCKVEEEEPVCGDGHLDAGEACDDGNNVDGDGCSASCEVEEEECDEEVCVKVVYENKGCTTPLKNVEVTIRGPKICKTKLTGSDGEICFTGDKIVPGKYYVEIKAPKGYEIDGDGDVCFKLLECEDQSLTFSVSKKSKSKCPPYNKKHKCKVKKYRSSHHYRKSCR